MKGPNDLTTFSINWTVSTSDELPSPLTVFWHLVGFVIVEEVCTLF